MQQKLFLRMRRLIGLLCFVLISIGCGSQAASNQDGGDPAEPTPSLTVELAPSITPRPTSTPWPTIAAPPTVTPLPAATPQPTPGALNADVPAKPKGGESCTDYPCPDDAAGWNARIQVPEGFSAEYFALIPDNPTSITFGPDDLMYVATMTGTIHTVDLMGNVETWFHGLNVPVGLAFAPGTDHLYVSDRVSGEEARVSVFKDDQFQTLVTGFPCCYAGMHAANGLAFGPDERLYIAVGARADHGEVLNTDEQDELHPWEASVVSIQPDGSDMQVYARGIRNAFDIAWDDSNRLFATNNGPDFGPPDTLYLVQQGGEHGYPWYECDNCFGPPPEGIDIVPPAHEFIAHSAPTGITAYLDDAFPGYYNNLFAVLWSAFEGAQKIVRFAPGATDSADFATGFAAPIDVTVGPNGNLYVVDWATGVLFKISYVGAP